MKRKKEKKQREGEREETESGRRQTCKEKE